MKTWKIKPKKLLLGPPISKQTPEDFIEYVKGLYNAAASKGSKSVDGVTLTLGKRTIVRIKRDPKALTRDEVARLAEEHETDEVSLLTLFHSRKIGITYGEGDERQIIEASIFAKKETKSRARKKTVKVDSVDKSAPESSEPIAAGNGN